MKVKVTECQIEMGSRPCHQIKNMYYPETPWIDCYKLVAIKFSELKNILRKRAASMNDAQLLEALGTFSQLDIQETFDEAC